MFRRFLRIFCVVGLVLMLGTAVVGQFWAFGSYRPLVHIAVEPAGVTLAYLPPPGYHEYFHRVQEWSANELLTTPRIWNGTGGFLPWWVLLLSWSLLTTLIWRLTRRRKISPAFPIESSINSAKSK
jgi:hypothetical protein